MHIILSFPQVLPHKCEGKKKNISGKKKTYTCCIFLG